ncbi:RNA polymerase II subunit A C-terminal domain phosphatase isoform X1 [Rhinopithecus roxellana]|uniref:RNA polymerase II subunit A C-terminal domain phosphatase isoform X1 n=3 Tax=Rhinopithecus roxellana TaxID=61622 RepID=UPI00123735AC|nr:RNA polymerase II subunit A C-terminal domain phosphatase isoform X1 [Rhinopithecus roxellana]
MELPAAGRVSSEGAPTATVAEVRCPGPAPLRLLEWRVAAGAAVRIGSVLAVFEAAASAQPAGAPQSRAASGGCVRPARPERRLRSERAGVVRELCAQPGQVVAPGAVLVKLEGCSHPVVMKGLCAECGQDLTQLQSKNGRQQVPLSTATVSMVHSVPELMVSSEQAELLGREDQQRLHRNRKLVLMVDLDQTLIHTTEQHCQQMSNKGIIHFQLGRGEPMLHTRLRPHCKDFLEKIAKLYELHVFTFGSRLYAHTIAGFLDPEKKLFSHRILSRDECIDPFSKTGNLRNLFPCGDSMVCIIDDREDVWKFAPNLITVKKYVYFQGTGDMNAPPGSRDSQTRRKVNHSSRGTEISEQAPPVREPEGGMQAPGVEPSNGLEKPAQELNGSEAAALQDLPRPGKLDERDTWPPAQAPTSSGELAGTPEPQGSCAQGGWAAPGQQLAQGATGTDLDFDLSSDSESSESEGTKSSSSASDGESEGKRSQQKPKAAPEGAGALAQGSSLEPGRPAALSLPGEAEPGTHAPDKGPELGGQEEGERDGLCGLGNGCADRKEAETESQNSELSGVTAGESLDQSVEEEEEEEEDTDEDDHLIYLEEILVRVHTDYYAKYDRFLNKEIEEAPDIRKIVPELKSKVLADVAIIFSGLHPTNFPIEKTREHYHATALGAKILTRLVLSPDAPDRATHLIAARAGTEKVLQAQECGHLHVVNPDWLWSCLERWDKVEEQLFPLRDDHTKAQRENSPAAFPDREGVPPTTLFHPVPVLPKAQPGPEVRIYDSNTGKLIRTGARGPPAPPSSLPVHQEPSSFRAVPPPQPQTFGEELPDAPDGEQPGPSRRKRQPSMSETMPLYTLCKEDLESMDKEVDDILGEGSDDSDSEKRRPEEQEEEPQPRTPGARRERTLGAAASSERSAAGGRGPRGHKRKLNEEDAASESSRESSNEDEGSSSEADEMAKALEAELNDLM